MTKFTKVANFIFRGSVVAALGTVAAELMTGGALFGNLFDGVKQIEDLAGNITGLNFADILGKAQMATMVLVLAAILSCVAFKCAGKVASIFRSVTLFGMAGLSALSMLFLTCADFVVRNMNGAATAEEIATLKPLVDGLAQQGQSQGAVAGTMAMAAVVLAGFVAAVLVGLGITSIVSVVKTVKAETCAA